MIHIQKKVTLHYSSMNLDEGYANQIIINQKAFPLIAANDSQKCIRRP